MLLPLAGPLATADATLAPLVTRQLLTAVVDLAPDDWIHDPTVFDDVAASREAYVNLLLARVAARSQWLAPLEAARAAR